jgi:hypothetical protein
MSITDASTNLSTTWAEQTTVAYTAGTLGTMTDCITEVEGHIQRGTLSATTTPTIAQVQNWLIRGKQQIAKRFGFTWKRRYAYATFTSAGWRFSLPPDYAGGEVRLRDITNEGWMKYIDTLLFDSKFPAPSSESSRNPDDAYFTIKGNEIWMSHPVGGDATIEIEYERSGDDNTATDLAWIPEPLRWEVVDYATKRAFMMLQQWTAAQAYGGEFEAENRWSRKADGRKRWAGGGFRIHNWF